MSIVYQSANPQLNPEQRALKLLLKDCAEGFYQQMYFLGKDVNSKAGNLLEEFGFTKSPSKGLKGTSCYTLEQAGLAIDLYGSCVGCYTDNGSVVFLRTHKRFFHWLAEGRCVAGLWELEDVKSGSPDSLFNTAKPLLEWWATYESWITKRMGPEYREACYKEWGRLKTQKQWLSPNDATTWLSGFLELGPEQVRPKHYKVADTAA